MENQISGFQISALLRELLDRVTTVAQNAFVTIDISDFALAGGGVHEARIVADQPFLVGDLDLEQIRRFDGAVSDRYFIPFARPVINYGQCLGSHNSTFQLSLTHPPSYF